MFYRNPNEIFIEELLAAYDLLNEQKSPNLEKLRKNSEGKSDSFGLFGAI
ncbi:4091_t:CDS:2 [Entrophospora sp. SA101]|nr:4091_t:CDS:2 [Entrophospora sp. SA101]